MTSLFKAARLSTCLHETIITAGLSRFRYKYKSLHISLYLTAVIK